jgi:hypothetical protein
VPGSKRERGGKGKGKRKKVKGKKCHIPNTKIENRKRSEESGASAKF